MSGISFGSVGDIIAICQIMQGVVKALSDSQGSAPEYQAFSEEISKLTETLKQIDRLRQTHAQEADTKPLNNEIETCRRCLEDILRKIKKYAASLAAKGSGNPILDAYWKLRWLNKKDQANEWKRAISICYSRLHLQLSILGMDVNESNTKEIHARFNTTESLLVQIVEAVQQRGKPDGLLRGRRDELSRKPQGGSVGGVLVSGYVRSSMQTVQDILSKVSKDPAHAVPVDLGYKKARAECIDKCRKIRDVCLRDNVYFRDTDFEADTDLLQGDKNCLHGLDLQDIEYSNYEPNSVKRVNEIFEKPEFYKDGATGADVETYMGQLWFESGLKTALNMEMLVTRLCVAQHPEVGVYGFVFYRDGEWFPVIIDDNLYLIKPNYEESKALDDALRRLRWELIADEQQYRRLFQTGSQALYFTRCRDPNETWVPLLEKAFVKAHGDYSSLALEKGFPGEALEDLTGGVSLQIHTKDIIDTERFWNDELSFLNNGLLFTVRTSPYNFEWYSSNEGHVAAPEGTSIIRTYEGYGERLLLLRGWQKAEWQGPWSNGSKEWTPDWMQRLRHDFGDTGTFWISYDDLLKKYTYFDRTRIFSPDWTVAQKWVALDIGRDDGTQDTGFAFTMYKDSSVVVAMSQLDPLYYRGLQGLHGFQLQFHIYKEGEPEHSVASRGNYLMSRSVSVEKTFEAGKYTIELYVSATKFEGAQSVKEVIKQNSKTKRSKLLQLGSHYDIAHAKALGWGALRAKQGQRLREAKERKRRARQEKATSSVGEVDDDEDDDEDEELNQWDAACAVGLKVYSHDPELELEIRNPPETYYYNSEACTLKDQDRASLRENGNTIRRPTEKEK